MSRALSRLNVPTPINALQMKMFDEIESHRRPMQWENLEELIAELARHPE